MSKIVRFACDLENFDSICRGFALEIMAHISKIEALDADPNTKARGCADSDEVKINLKRIQALFLRLVEKSSATFKEKLTAEYLDSLGIRGKRTKQEFEIPLPDNVIDFSERLKRRQKQNRDPDILK